ncbi:MAG: 2-succinyl-5-enolpyruvyl-6-hydroxy-3-cyclohexene-1-carboxylic-acid synthase [Betaproteobacteria bacterium]|nr:2-succinyl-5-enolpyruvyl-6-hydroxy-3-cyclohexene-1-carboxylic-acid synthase [Betaproteobacteria bacterium]
MSLGADGDGKGERLPPDREGGEGGNGAAPGTAALNLRWCDTLVAGLAAAGLRRAVIAPGARSSALALAFLRRPEIICEVISDERVAGYFALGLAKVAGEPAALLCTSGTAAANLFPAVMEASLAAVPMLVLTADRPPEMQSWGANQTTDQLRLYGSHVRAFHAVPVPDGGVAPAYLHALAARLMEQCRAPLPGPVHANLPFREPLVPTDTIPGAPDLPPAIELIHPQAAPTAQQAAELAGVLSGGRGVILCGEEPYPPGFDVALAQLATRLGAPVLAEPLSNLRFSPAGGAEVFARQAAFLHTAAGFDPDWVLRFGGFPVSRRLERWLAGLRGSRVVMVAPSGRWPDPLWQVHSVVRCAPLALLQALAAQPLSSAPAHWLRSFRDAERHMEDAAEGVCAGEEPFEGAVARTLLHRLPPGAHCFVGNSLAIRAVDMFSGCGAHRLVLHGNRGASGIDGNLATTAGIAAACGAPVAALVGDQAALHDSGGLAALRGRNALLVVMDNGGGGIFDHLPLGALGAMAETVGEFYGRAWIASAPTDFRALAAAHGLVYRRALTMADLATSLNEALGAAGAWLIHVRIDRARSLDRFRRHVAACASARST